LIHMPLSARRGDHRASMAGTIGLPGIGWVGEPWWAAAGCMPQGCSFEPRPRA